MADKRAFFKLDVGYYDNPKIVPLLDEDQPWAVHLHQASMAYSAQHLTDGVVRVKTMLRKIPATDADVQALIAAGLWVDLGDGQVRVHDYLEHNRSAAEAKSATDKARRAAAARYVAAPDEAPEHAHDDASGTAFSSASGTASGMPREKEREREIKSARKRGTRLPDDWTPSDDLKRWTSEDCPGLNGPVTAAKFRDYWHGVAGAKGVKLDWDATWRNWCRNEYERSAR